MFRFTLPTTGYIQLRTSTWDGHEPLHATVFSYQDDPVAARAAYEREVAMLREHAPSNVTHDVRFVRRVDPDGASDTVLAEALGIRGNGAPLRPCQGPGCDKPIPPGSRADCLYHNGTCQVAAYRARKRGNTAYLDR